MTKEQEATVRRIRREADEQLIYNEDTEYKTFDVKEHSSFVTVRIITGRKNDEGTLVSLMRNYVTVFVGPRGGLTYVNKRGTIKRLGRGINLWQVIYENE